MKTLLEKNMPRECLNCTLILKFQTIEPLYSFVGASPDAVVSCTCCGHGVLEVKCPFSCKDKSLQTVANDNSISFCMKITMRN